MNNNHFINGDKLIKSKLKGFSIVELAITMAVMAILTSAITPVVIKSIHMKAAEKTALEMSLILESSKNFYVAKKIWPQNIQEIKDAGFLNQDWSLENPWHGLYATSQSSNLFSVFTDKIPLEWTTMVSRFLPSSVVLNDKITSSISIPGGGQSSLQAGVIVAWSGLIEDIPEGWWLCDGTHGTPNLMDKFIIGASLDHEGKAQSTIFGSNGIVKEGGTIHHDHTGITNGHALAIDEMPRHHHGYMATPWTGSRYDGHSSPLMTQQIQGQTDDTGGDLITGKTNPHSHTIVKNDHLPPFYALAFIMKLP